MLTGTIADGVVQIVIKGFDALQAQLSRVRQSFDRTAQAAANIGIVAGNAFSQATSAVSRFVSVADPLGFLQFQIALDRLSVQIGRIFVPVLREATERILKLRDFFASLSDETREQIATFAKWGIAISGATLGLTKLAGVGAGLLAIFGNLLPLVTGIAQGFWRVLGFLGPWGRLAVVIGTVAAALFGLSKATDDTDSALGKLTAAFRRAWDVITGLWGRLVEFFTPIVERVTDAVVGAWAKVLDTITAAWERLGPKVMPLVEKVFQGVGRAFEFVADLYVRYVGAIVTAFERVAPAAERVFLGIVAVAERVVLVVGKVQAAVARMFQGAGIGGDDLSEPFEAVQRVAQRVFDVIGRYVDVFRDKFFALIERLQPSFERVGAAAGRIFDKLASAAEKIGAALWRAIERVQPFLERFGSELLRQLEASVDLALKLVELFVTNLADAVDAVLPLVEAYLDSAVDIAEWLINALVTGFEQVEKIVNRVIDGFRDGFLSAIKTITSGFNAMMIALVRAVNSLIDQLNTMIQAFNELQLATNKVAPIQIPKVGRIDIGPIKLNLPDPLPRQPKPQGPPGREFGDVPPEVAGIRNKRDVRGEDGKTKPGPQDPRSSGFSGQLLGQVRIVGIADAMKQAQQNTQLSREAAILEEIAKTQKEAAGALKDIKNNTDIMKEKPAGLGF